MKGFYRLVDFGSLNVQILMRGRIVGTVVRLLVNEY